MLKGEVQVFLDHADEWKFYRSVLLQTRWTGLHEAEMAAMLRRGEQPEIRTIDIPVSALASYVDRQLKQMGWKRTSDLHSWPATQPTTGFDVAPNRAAECSLRRGWLERRYLRRMAATRREQELREREGW